MSADPSPQDEAETEDTKFVGGYCDPDGIKMLDAASGIVGQSRGKFLIEAGKERARAVLASPEGQRIVRPA